MADDRTMISLLLAAVIAQPLDAEYTATAHGISVTVRHPASWKPQPFSASHGVARLVSTDGQEARLWVTDELTQFAARGQDQAAASAEFDFIDSGKLLEPFTAGSRIVNGGTTYLGGRPARFLELASSNGTRQFLVGRLEGRRGVVLAVGSTDVSVFDANRATLSAVAQSLRTGPARRPWPWGWLAVSVGIVLALVFFHRIINRRATRRSRVAGRV